ncbi:type VI secretion system baseplate subunit TssE [Massilia sp. S19_KUP03_FR1]|uniref:type VI secretion system baseplate subunit TssE n=1 Tax=Massilia sp. S19_KUP03_FR1 TaxID=3025503 RepID=UPI002FCD8097
MHLTHSSLPLFDRFVEVPGIRLTALEALQLSLRLDLTRLFNARNGMTVSAYLDGAPTPRDYGLPDTLALSAQLAADLQRWELVLTRAIAIYEPRLIHVRVTVMPDAANSTSARVAIAALAQLRGQLCQFHFDTTL